ncbi:hypothetical protein [Streptomyces sp. 6N106]|uniref:hypothetical protein n=1 Tax=Streptomyces sp. 6N106 TaxID=3457418 RepID=UPI003FD494D5
MEAWRPRIQEMADELVGAMVAEGSPADLRAAVALPLPVRVICAPLGAPSEDHDKFARWSETLLTLTRYTQAEVDEAQAEFHPEHDPQDDGDVAVATGTAPST